MVTSIAWSLQDRYLFSLTSPESVGMAIFGLNHRKLVCLILTHQVHFPQLISTSRGHTKLIFQCTKFRQKKLTLDGEIYYERKHYCFSTLKRFQSNGLRLWLWKHHPSNILQFKYCLQVIKNCKIKHIKKEHKN